MRLSRIKKKFSYRPVKQSVNYRIAALVFLAVLAVFPFSRHIKTFFYSASESLQYWLWTRGLSGSRFFQAVLKSQDLRYENEDLKMENAEMFNKLVELEDLKKENEILKTALGLELEQDFSLILAYLTAKEPGRDYLIANKGSEDGIEVGFPVITAGRVLVGKVSEVYDNFSKIEVISARDSSFDVEIAGKNIYSLAKGKGDLKLFLDLVPKEDDVGAGDKVITSALGGKFPKSLFVGEVKNVRKSDVSAFQEIEAGLGFDVNDLEAVFVISNSNG